MSDSPDTPKTPSKTREPKGGKGKDSPTPSKKPTKGTTSALVTMPDPVPTKEDLEKRERELERRRKARNKKISKGLRKTLNKLSFREKKFIQEYFIDLNATQAASRAGYSKKSAASIGSLLLRRLEVRKAIQTELRARLRDPKVVATKVVETLMTVAFSDITDLMDINNTKVTIKDLKDLPRESRLLISSIEEKVNNAGISTIKVQFQDRLKALELLGRYLKLFNEQFDININTKVEHEHTYKMDLSQLSVEELKQLKELHAKAGIPVDDEIEDAEVIEDE